MTRYLKAGKVRPFAGDGEIIPGLTATLHPGHTPGSAFFTLESRGERLVFAGDIVHSAAVQLPAVATTIVYDEDQDRAAGVRVASLARFAKAGTLIALPHMPFPGIGHVRAEGTGYGWVPATYTNREAK